ncbi:MAG TPA: PRC and DUF2382 domain-containing protein, partial [Gaiellaceae bacterium]|nr:PRC and DUF2382 domain-containing protein [Gaiellaceae bacterium]
MTHVTMEAIAAARGADVYSSDGEKIGSVDEIYHDYETRQPEWIGIGTGIFSTKHALVPVEGAELRSDGLFVPYSKDQVTGAPEIDADQIDESTERSLYEHYGLSYSERRSGSTLPEGGPGTTEGAPGTMGAEDEAPVEHEGAVTRHEEELRVGKREAETGQARLRKWVETEPVSEDVELRRERARVTREPVDRPAGDADIGEEEIDVPLRGEEAVVEKETVARERVGLEKDVDTERETVGGDVRKERVDVEGDLE